MGSSFRTKGTSFSSPQITGILNMGITWISWGAALGYINIAPLGLEDSYLSYFCFSKSPVCSLLEYNS